MFGMSQREKVGKEVRRASIAAMIVEPIESAELQLSIEARACFQIEAVAYRLHGLYVSLCKAFPSKSWATFDFFSKHMLDGVADASIDLGLNRGVGALIARRMDQLLKSRIDFARSALLISDIDKDAEVEDVLSALKNGTDSYVAGVMGVILKI